jgi:Co/Zn/Cd efflux system component
MAGGNCCCTCEPAPPTDRTYRYVLWGALAVNAAMFVVELVAGAAAGSVSLWADSTDFAMDAANYAVSLFVLSRSAGVRAGAALVKGITLGNVGLWVAIMTAGRAWRGGVPEVDIMSVVGALALAANIGCAAMLYAFRRGDANRRSVWICSRNDAIGNVAVMLAAGGVWATGSGWPDLAVAAVMSTLAVSGALGIIRQAWGELKAASRPADQGQSDQGQSDQGQSEQEHRRPA